MECREEGRIRGSVQSKYKHQTQVTQSIRPGVRWQIVYRAKRGPGPLNNVQGVLISSRQATGCPDIITPGYRVSWYNHARLQGVLPLFHSDTGCPDIISLGYRCPTTLSLDHRLPWHYIPWLQGALILFQGILIIIASYNLSQRQVTEYQNILPQQAVWCPDIITTATRVSRH